MAKQEIQRRPQHNAPVNCSEEIDNAITHLSACLALVRPAGMSDEAAVEWLSVASQEVRGIAPEDLARRCKMARQECTFHGQIVPFILSQGIGI